MNRDCMNSFNGGYPVYPMPYMPMNAPIAGIPTQQIPNNSQSNDLTSIKNELSRLDRRVTAIENMLSNNYNSSNFQVI